MASEAELLALAERCEKASGPNEELNAAIRCAVFAPTGAFVKQSPINAAWCIYEVGYNGRERSWEPRGLSQLQRLGDFTASLDAAITLVPDNADSAGERYRLEAYNSPGVLEEHVRASAWVAGAPRCYAATAALALTAAALRARAATIGGTDGQ